MCALSTFTCCMRPVLRYWCSCKNTLQALKTNDIFRTMRLMKANSGLGGFEFMAPPGPAYYRDVPRRIPSLTEDQLEQLEVNAGIFALLVLLTALAPKGDDRVAWGRCTVCSCRRPPPGLPTQAS